KIEEHASHISNQIASNVNLSDTPIDSSSTDRAQLAKVVGQAAGHKSTLKYLSGIMLQPHTPGEEGDNMQVASSSELTPELISTAQEEIKTVKQVIDMLNEQDSSVDDMALEYLDNKVKNLEEIIASDPA